jgi:predicted DNA-binding protein
MNAKRQSVSLSSDVAELLAFLAESQGITQSEAIRKAIITEAYFRKEIEKGGEILVRKPDKDIQEVIFR